MLIFMLRTHQFRKNNRNIAACNTCFFVLMSSTSKAMCVFWKFIDVTSLEHCHFNALSEYESNGSGYIEACGLPVPMFPRLQRCIS